MADSELIDALAECLEALREDEAKLQACLERHASHRAELEALLEVVRLIPQLPASVAPSASFRERTRRRLMGEAPTPSELSWRDADPS